MTLTPTPARLGSADSGAHAGATRLVVGIGDAPGTAGPLAWVVQQSLARSLPVLIVHAWRRPRLRTDDLAPDELSPDAPGAQAAALAVDFLHSQGVDARCETVDDGNADALLSMLEPDDEVVVGLRRGDLVSRVMGPDTVHDLLRRAPCPVAVVPDVWCPPAPGTLRVVIGYDATPRADHALAWAISECRSLGARLEVALVRLPVELHAEGLSRTDVLDRIRAFPGATAVPDVRVVTVSPVASGSASALAEMSIGAQALVLGNHRASWLAQLTQTSVTESAVSHASCPVVAVPGDPAER